MYLHALLEEFKFLPWQRKIGCFLHFIMLMSIAAYFVELPTDEEFLSLTSADEDEDEDDAFKVHGEKLARRSQFSNTKRDWKRFLTTARRAPLYALPPFIFVLYVGILNILSYHIRTAPILQRSWKLQYRRLAQQYSDPRWIRDFTLDLRPLFLGWVYLIPPITMLNMIIHKIHSLVNPLIKHKTDHVFGIPCLRLAQQVPTVQRRSFVFSPWFSIVTLLPFVLGIPTVISLWIYWHLGVDATLHFPSRDPFFNESVTINLYITCLAACLSTLFFCSYFTYPLNFCSTEYDIEIFDDVIKALPIKGWFADFISLRQMHSPRQICWTDVTSVAFSGGKLKTNLAISENRVIAVFEKLSSVYESLTAKFEIHSEILRIVGKNDRAIDINLWELTPEQKLDLFYRLRKNAAHIHLSDQVQRALTGSTVLKEPRYTEIWFSVLNRKPALETEGDLENDKSLRDGRYKIKSKIASGGQAVIYLAIDDRDKFVVLKEFRLTSGESLSVEIESAKDFENESAIIDQLSHPAVVKSLDMFYEAGRVYLVLEHVEGKSLRQLVRENGAQAETEIFELAEQMCDILKHLHSQEPPVVHRDFTPDNLIIQPNGKLKLIDFSTAHQRQESSNDCAGKHSYTPPEQFRGDACPQSDIYALGATLFFLATGKDPLPISTSSLETTGYSNTNLLSHIISNTTELNLSRRYESIDWVLLALQTRKVDAKIAHSIERKATASRLKLKVPNRKPEKIKGPAKNSM